MSVCSGKGCFRVPVWRNKTILIVLCNKCLQKSGMNKSKNFERIEVN